MPVVLPNVYFDVYRGRYDQNSEVTGNPGVYLTDKRGNMSPMVASDFTFLGALEPGVKLTYVLSVDRALDVTIDDYITNIRLLDKKTPWEFAGPAPDDADYPRIVWIVRIAQVAAAGLLTYKMLYIERIATGGSFPA